MPSDPETPGPTGGEAGLDPSAVCTLPPDALDERRAWIRREILPHALAREPLPDGVAWELADSPGLAAQLDRLVELEAGCCSGIVFAHRPLPGTGRRRLEVRGIDPRTSVLARFEELLR